MKNQMTQCKFKTKKGKPCQGSAWWEDGFCYQHVPSLDFSEWIIGLAKGAVSQSLPSGIQLFGIIIHIPFWNTDNDTKYNYWSRNLKKSWGTILPAKIVLAVGSWRPHEKDFYMVRSNDPRIRVTISPPEAIIASDNLLSKIDSRAANLISNQIFASAERCSVLEQWRMQDGCNDPRWKNPYPEIKGYMGFALKRSSTTNSL